MKEFEKMLSGELYNPNSDYLADLREKNRMRLKRFNDETFDENRKKILQTILGKVGSNCFVTPNFFCDYGANIEFGDNVYLNANCTILDCAKVKIGNNTLLGPNVQLYTPLHPLDYKTRNTGLEYAKPITIEDNCWLAGGVIVLAGITIQSGSVIGAGSVVTKDIPSNVLAVGNPAKVIRHL